MFWKQCIRKFIENRITNECRLNLFYKENEEKAIL